MVWDTSTHIWMIVMIWDDEVFPNYHQWWFGNRLHCPKLSPATIWDKWRFGTSSHICSSFKTGHPVSKLNVKFRNGNRWLHPVLKMGVPNRHSHNLGIKTFQFWNWTKISIQFQNWNSDSSGTGIYNTIFKWKISPFTLLLHFSIISLVSSLNTESKEIEK